MTAAQHDQPETQAPARAPRRRGLATHRAFAPTLGLWGAALAGLSVLVLPAQFFAHTATRLGLALPPVATQSAIAALSALVLGGIMFLMARRAGRKARTSNDEARSLVAAAKRRLHTIDPQRDLGSASLDEPVAAAPFGGPDPVVGHAQAPATDMPPPRALDLEDFAALPGRNAVWVEDVPEAGDAAESLDPVPPAIVAPAAAPVPTALARLRATPPEQLSLIQMVERFAGALHEHRAAPPGKPVSAQDVAAREAALTEALRALAALSADPGRGSAGTAQSAPLRDVLTRLQGLEGMRGAA
jgi:hypothetical protein